jgi:hypothetical protein
MYYFLTLIFGLFGLLALLRSAERLMGGAGVLPTQVIMALVGLVLAAVFLRKARSAKDNS